MSSTSESAGRYRLIGGNASPYSMKLRAIMRYRRLPHDWVLRTPAVAKETAHLKPQLVPILRYPEDGSYHLDSTPLAYALETRHPGERSIIPDDPGHAFLSHLIEDMGDEWFTKAMFHYRFAGPVDQDYGARWVVDDARSDLDGAALAEAAEAFKQRQIGRIPLVGATAENAAVIEASYHRLLAILESHVGNGRFLFGSRPALADFGLFGQLKTLATDPTPLAIMRAEAPRVEHWVRRLDDASGVAGDWIDPEAPLPDAVIALLQLASELYLPFLLANAEARAAGEATFRATLLGKPYGQGVFPYQVKCLSWLRDELAGLSDPALGRTRAVLEETGCWSALQPD
ncbi:MAG: glutathione S-transferase C-terminal domain-containing protein [Alphaproteobacteria bacterium]|nr:glutathione S-transferase C-terminal domain-containing protein [Alphaproteobacteria bacterium]